jgi:hypothetical protein
MHPLDRPVWSALNGPQSALAQGTLPALRIDPAYGPFAAAAPGHEAALAGLLWDADDEIWLIEGAILSPPPGLAVRKEAHLVQMVAQGPPGLPMTTIWFCSARLMCPR